MERFDVAVIGAGPAGTAAAIRASRSGASVAVFERGARGRDKVCGDGLTPRAVAALQELKAEPEAAHRIDGLRMIAGRKVRELPWPSGTRYPAHGAVLPRRILDAHLADLAAEAGAELRWQTEALPWLEGSHVAGVETPEGKVRADLVILATGAAGAAARMVGAERVRSEPFGLAIRSYARSPRHLEHHLEACLTIRDAHGVTVPGYGWLFPAGDGTVNIGVGVLSTMKGFSRLNLHRLLGSYADGVREAWGLGEYREAPRAWRLPMSVQRRHGPGWVAVGDAAGLVNPMNGEGIDYGLESGMLAADCFIADPASAPATYDQKVGERFDAFLRTGRRFSFLIGHPGLMRTGLRVALGTSAAADVTLAVMGNLVDSESPGASGRVLRTADRLLAAADPLLRRTRARR